MSDVLVAHNTPEDLMNHYAYVDGDGGVQLGFLIGWNTNEGLNGMANTLYSLVGSIAEAVHGDPGDMDFELIHEMVDGHIQTQIAFASTEGSYIFLRDSGVLSNTLEALKKATASGDLKDFKLQLDLVRPDPKRVRLISFHEELTGDMG